MFEWRDAFSVGDAQIDAQHKQLFALAHELHQAMLNGKAKSIMETTLAKLVDYTVYHFEAEEKLMRVRRYPGRAEHELIHLQFAARVRGYQNDYKTGAMLVNVALLDALQKWLVEHIRQMDAGLAQARAA